MGCRGFFPTSTTPSTIPPYVRSPHPLFGPTAPPHHLFLYPQPFIFISRTLPVNQCSPLPFSPTLSNPFHPILSNPLQFSPTISHTLPSSPIPSFSPPSPRMPNMPFSPRNIAYPTLPIPTAFPCQFLSPSPKPTSYHHGRLTLSLPITSYLSVSPFLRHPFDDCDGHALQTRDQDAQDDSLPHIHILVNMTQTRIHRKTQTHPQIHIHTLTGTHRYTHSYTDTLMPTQIHTRKNMPTHVYTHRNKHKHTTHTQVHKPAHTR